MINDFRLSHYIALDSNSSKPRFFGAEKRYVGVIILIVKKKFCNLLYEIHHTYVYQIKKNNSYKNLFFEMIWPKKFANFTN